MKRMGSKFERWAQATLTVYSRTRSAQELMEIISVEPSRSWQKGTRRGRGLGNVHPYSGLTYESQVDHATDISAHIDDLLHRLAPAADALTTFAKDARSQDPETIPIRVELLVESTNREAGFDITHPQLKTITDLGGHIVVEVEVDEEVLNE
jgi:hypothetical protein